MRNFIFAVGDRVQHLSDVRLVGEVLEVRGDRITGRHVRVRWDNGVVGWVLSAWLHLMRRGR